MATEPNPKRDVRGKPVFLPSPPNVLTGKVLPKKKAKKKRNPLYGE